MNEKRKVLHIDDDDDSLDLLEMFLYDKYELLTARNGFEGLKVAEEYHPDVIVSDIMMPEMDGIRFFNELRKREKTARIPVIAVTSFIEQFTKKSLLNMGFESVVSKPLRRDVIAETVANVLAALDQQQAKDAQAEV